MASATVDLNANTTNFVRGMAQADAAQKKLANSWEANIGGIFKRSPFARAERALSEFAVQLGGGNLGGAFSALATRVTGFGLAVGLALGSGIGLFQKLRSEAKAASVAVGALNKELAIPLSVQGNLGPGIATAVERDNKLLDDLIAKRDTIGAKIAEHVEANADQPRGFLNARDLQRLGLSQQQIIDQITNRPKPQQTGAAKAQEGIEERIGELIQKRAEYEEKIANLKSRQSLGDKVAASLEQNRLSFEQTKAELTERALKDASRDAFSQLGSFVALQRSISSAGRLRTALDSAEKSAANAKTRALVESSIQSSASDLAEGHEGFGNQMAHQQLNRSFERASAQERLEELSDSGRSSADPEVRALFLSASGRRAALEDERRFLRQRNAEDLFTTEPATNNLGHSLEQALGREGFARHMGNAARIREINQELESMNAQDKEFDRTANPRNDADITKAIKDLGTKMDEYWK